MPPMSLNAALFDPLRPTAPGICAQAESAFPTLGAWRGPGREIAA